MGFSITSFVFFAGLAGWFCRSVSAAACGLARDRDRSRCEVVGKLPITQELNYPAGDPQIVSSVPDCASLCARRIASVKQNQFVGPEDYPKGFYCKSFYYDIREKICQLGLINTTKVLKPDSNNYKVFYDNDCWDCGAFCDQPYGSQLLDNGDFEKPLFGPWSTFQGELFRQNTTSQYFKCHSESVCQLEQNLNLCQGQLYQVEFEYFVEGKQPSDKYRLVLNVQYPSSSTYIYSSVGNLTQAMAWTKVRGYFGAAMGPHPGPQFQFAATDSDPVYFLDNVKIARVPAPVAKPSTKSVFTNGDFERGQLAPAWSFIKYEFGSNATFNVVSPGLEGSGFAVRWVYNFDPSGYLVQELPTNPGSTYLFSVDVESLGGEMLVFFDFGPPHDRQVYRITFLQGIGTFSTPVLTTTSSTVFRMQIYRDTDNGNKTFDNFKFIEIEASAFY